MMLLNIIFNFLFVSVAWAQSCPTKNLLTEPNSPFNKIPVYNQDGSGTCYAFTASQLANYYLINNKKSKGPVVHPLWVALSYVKVHKGTTIRGGFVDEALDSISDVPVCNYQSVANSLSEIAKEYGMNDHEVIGFIENFSINFRNEIKKKAAEESKSKRDKENFIRRYDNPMPIDNTYVHVNRPLLNERELILRNLFYNALNDTISYMKEFTSCTESNMRQLTDALAPLLKMTESITFRALLNSDCKQTTPIKLPKTKIFKADFDNKFKKSFREHFANSNQPLGIHYCSTVLSNPNNDYIDGGGQSDKTRKTKKGCGQHASILVASRPSKNSCEYLLRNTWGAGYGSWTKNWKCACKNKKTGAYFNDCKKDSHPVKQYEVVGCWIPEDKMIKNTYGAQWLE